MMRRTLGWASAAALAALCCATLGAAGAASLTVAAEQGNRSAVESLIRQGVNVNQADGDGVTALHWAANHSDLALVKELLAHGANVNARTKLGGYAPLHLAAQV